MHAYQVPPVSLALPADDVRLRVSVTATQGQKECIGCSLSVWSALLMCAFCTHMQGQLIRSA